MSVSKPHSDAITPLFDGSESALSGSAGLGAGCRQAHATETAEKARPLGTVTKNYSPQSRRASQAISGEYIDHETGELVNPKTPTAYRLNRYALKSVVRVLMFDHRTANCHVLRAPIPGRGLADINVCKGASNGKAFYQGLMTCGNVWVCPLCAAKISERRRNELKDALDAAKAKGWNIHFVTLTTPHGVGDDIYELLAKQRKALRCMSQGKYSVNAQLAKILPTATIHGYIRAFEVTHGENGFHPHYHILVFTDRATTTSIVGYVYSHAWRRACRLAGLPEPHETYGCTAQDGTYASEYASKWGLEDEMTKSHSKQTRRKGVTPFGLLRCVLDGDDPDYPPARAGKLFQVYAHAFKGRRQLHWSVGLRAKLALSKELTDEELAAKPDDERALILATLTDEEWRGIRIRGHEAHILDVAESAPQLLPEILKTYGVLGAKEPEPDPHQLPSR